MSAADEDDWQEVWDARAEALARVLGPAHDQVFHALVPLAFGGHADVMVFKQHLDGVVYVTADLTGKPDACSSDYELMICHRSAQNWGPNILSKLAPYSQKKPIGAGHSMDIGSATPAASPIRAFLFDTYGTFTLFGRENELRLCIGITKPELEYKLQHGSQKLLELLKRHNVYPFTDLERDSVSLNG